VTVTASSATAPTASSSTSLKSVVANYRLLPRLAGRTLLPIGFLARLPLSMTQIGTVVLVSTTFQSVGAGGVAAGFLAAGAAIGGPVVGQLADRFGQRGVMLTASLFNAATTLALVALVLASAPLGLVWALALLSGASTPQIGAMLRARWVRITKGGARLGYAMSYEGAADETAYVLGPAAVSLMTALASPAVAMVTAALLVGIFGSAVALHGTAIGAPERTAPKAVRSWTNPAVLALIGGSMAIGCFFGGMQTGVTGMATRAGIAGASGGIYAIMGVGSAIAGLACAGLPARFALRSRLSWSASALSLLATPLLFVTGLPVMIALLLPLGCAVGPYIITLFSLAEREVTPDQTAGVMTLLSSGLVVGYAIGSSVGGRLADSGSPSTAFAVSAVAMAAGTAVSILAGRRRVSAVAGRT